MAQSPTKRFLTIIFCLINWLHTEREFFPEPNNAKLGSSRRALKGVATDLGMIMSSINLEFLWNIIQIQFYIVLRVDVE